MAIDITTYPTNITEVVDIFTWANTEVNGLIGIGFLVVFFVVSTLTMKQFETKKPFAAAAFGTGIVAGLMWSIELLPFKYAGLTIVIAAFSLLWLVWERD